MSNNFRITLTAWTRPTSVAPVLGGGAPVCPDVAGYAMRPRAIDGFAAHKGQGPQSWSPPPR